MSVVIVGGNECMVGRYKALCKDYGCPAKVFAKKDGSLKGKIGSPDLLVLFTGMLSHKMLFSVMQETKGGVMAVAKSHTGSLSALRRILEEHAGR